MASGWLALGRFLAKTPSRIKEAEAVYYKATEVNPENARAWRALVSFWRALADKPGDAEVAFRTAIQLQPEDAGTIRNFGVLLWCELGDLRAAQTTWSALIGSTLKTRSPLRSPWRAGMAWRS